MMDETQTPVDTTQQATSKSPVASVKKNPKRVASANAIALLINVNELLIPCLKHVKKPEQLLYAVNALLSFLNHVEIPEQITE